MRLFFFVLVLWDKKEALPVLAREHIRRLTREIGEQAWVQPLKKKEWKITFIVTISELSASLRKLNGFLTAERMGKSHIGWGKRRSFVLGKISVRVAFNYFLYQVESSSFLSLITMGSKSCQKGRQQRVPEGGWRVGTSWLAALFGNEWDP